MIVDRVIEEIKPTFNRIITKKVTLSFYHSAHPACLYHSAAPLLMLQAFEYKPLQYVLS